MSLPLLTIIVLVYLFVVGFLTAKAYKDTKNTADYMVAGRQIHPFVMAVSYGATFISTSAIIGFGGAAAVFGMSLLWLTFLTIFIGVFIAFVFFGRKTRVMGRNLNAHTFPEFLGLRFQSTKLQGVIGATIFATMPLYASVVLMGGAKFVAQILTIDYNIALFFLTIIIAIYVVMGGLKGVMYTDAFQGSIMFISMIILLVFTYNMLGGVVSAHQELSSMKDLAIKFFGAKGHTGWTSFPTFLSEYWLVVVTTIIMGVGIGVLAQPQLIVRFMTVKSNRELNRAVLIGAIFIMVAVGVSFIVGALSNVYFLKHDPAGKISLLAANKNVANIIPLYISHAMPQWFTAIFMVTLLSAAMSTLSSQFHAMGTSLGRDIYEKALGKTGDSILITKIGIIVAIIISYFLAWGLPQFFEGGTAIIARGTAIFMGICAAAFLPMYFGALYIKNMTKTAAYASFVVGIFSSIFWLFFVHIKESKPLLICKTIFGVDSLALGTKWALVDPLIIALPASILALIIFLKVGPKPGKEHIKMCFAGIK
ncbi:MAG: sodium:solute symporter family protein [Desulfotalea sp.]